MQPAEVLSLVLALLLVVALLTVAARRLGIPYPILMTLGGLALGVVLGLVPGQPRVELAPELVFLLFLPPLLFGAAFFTSPRELADNARPIGLLAVGLVLATTVIVAVIVHTLAPGVPWAVAFVLGAVVSPPDAVAATSIAQRLGLPRRVVIILEGESLVNDATALVAYRLAVAAAVSGAFSLGEATLSFAVVSVGGVVIGLAAGWAITFVLARLEDPPVEVLLSLLAPFGAWLPAETLGVSGVLSVVTAGIVVGRRAPRIMSSDTRVLGSGVWQMVVFTLTGLVFILIGLQLPTILDSLSASRSFGELASWAVVVSVTVILVRLAWVFPGTYLPRLLSARVRERERMPAPRNVLIVGWAGMRGVVSLAAALALPLEREERRALPRARPRHLPDLLGHPGHARRPGAHAAISDPVAGRGRRRVCGARGVARPRGRGAGRHGAPRRAGHRVAGPPGADRPPARAPRARDRAPGARPRVRRGAPGPGGGSSTPPSSAR